MKRSSAVFCLVFFGLLTMATFRAGATTLLPKDFQDLAREADVVFVGTVTDVYSDWDGEPYHSKIHTYVTFTDLEIIAGEYEEASIEVRFLGGEVDDIRVEYSGVPKFLLGNRHLIFLSGNFKALCPIVGWGQGLFKVVTDLNTGQEILYSRSGKLVEGVTSNKIIMNSEAPRVLGSPGISKGSYRPSAQRLLVDVGNLKKIPLKNFAESIRKMRSELKEKGIRTGYIKPVSRSDSPAIPADAAYFSNSTSQDH